MSKPLVIGLTGGIGSGKSTVAKIFNSLGVFVFNSDNVAKTIINTSNEVVEQVEKEFGDVYTDGLIDSDKLAELVFNDKQALKTINQIIHPKVKESFDKWLITHENEKILIKESAILLESGIYREMDKVILVVASKELRIERVSRRDAVDGGDVEKRIENQFSDDEKIKLVDYIINNDESNLLLPQVLKLHQEIINLKA